MEHIHEAEPVGESLAMAKIFATGGQVTEFCDECGRRLARACIHWSDWVLRRSEKVRFSDDRCVSRLISIDFLVREDAPVYQGTGGRRYWLVPVSIMRRKTLVNYSLRDERGHHIALPGLLLTQHLDETLLRAVASRELGRALSAESENFIHDVVAGSIELVETRMYELESGAVPDDIIRLDTKEGVFIRLLKRMAYCYTLYAYVDAIPAERHRRLQMSIEEPLSFYYEPEEPELTESEESRSPAARSHGTRRRWWLHTFMAALGLATTKVRFRVPAAENTASFHFEIDAPPGVDIVQASVLAAVPDKNGDDPAGLHPWQYDHIRMGLPTVGLHVIAVPNGSFSVAQVDLQVATRGWYATMLLSCWSTFLLLIALALHVRTHRIDTTSTTDVVVFLAGVAAAVATLIAQGEFSGLAGRLLSLPRILAALEAGLLLIAATLFLFVGPNENRRRPWELLALCVIAGVITIIVSTSWVLARSRLGRRRQSVSPREAAPGLRRSVPSPTGFWNAVDLYGYRMPAIRVDSGEAWHYHFHWTPEIEADAVALLGEGHR